MSLTICKASPNGLHRYEWSYTDEHGWNWVCVLPDCDDVELETTGHHGGFVDARALILGTLMFAAVAACAWMDAHQYDNVGTPYTTEVTHVRH